MSAMKILIPKKPYKIECHQYTASSTLKYFDFITIYLSRVSQNIYQPCFIYFHIDAFGGKADISQQAGQLAGCFREGPHFAKRKLIKR